MNYRDEAPQVIKDYLLYIQNIRGKSQKTVNEYYIDLRTFFRYIKISRNIVDKNTEFENIQIDDISIELIRTITLNEAYEFMDYLISVRNNNAASRSRKCSSLKGFFEFLYDKKHLIENNPIARLETPKKKNSLPKYLTLEQSLELLNSVDGPYRERDFCIITIFLNCGLRVSEMAGLNYSDIRNDNTIRVVGKGNKERIVYLNNACIDAIQNYMQVRPTDKLKDKKALFISRNNNRMSVKTIQAMVYKYLAKIGLDAQGYSCHKLRHTAATLMYQHGGVDIRVLKDMLGHENLGTTEIYTHLSSEQMKNAANSNPLANVSFNKTDTDNDKK
ncbi:MAG: tyrosine recombinase XerC [Ruminococcus sp.]|nr:tyrosine recombinase XerC [Ruminococcus sp.]